MAASTDTAPQGTASGAAADSPDPVIRVRNLVKRYGDITAVDGIDLEVRRGEILAFLGPNGAGKTTTTEILEGFLKRTGGEVTVLGTDPAQAGPDWRARIGVVLQTNAPERLLTVRECLTMYAGDYPGHCRSTASWTWSTCRTRRAAGAISCPAASSAGWTSRWRWSATPS